MTRIRLALLCLFLGTAQAKAANFENSGLRISLPEEFFLLEEKKELTTSERIIQQIETSQTFRSGTKIEGDTRIGLRVRIRYIQKVALPAQTEEQLGRDLAAAKEKIPTASVQQIPFGAGKALYVDDAYSPKGADGPQAHDLRYATVSASLVGARVELLVMYPSALISSADVRKAIEGITVDEGRIKALIAESDGIKAAAVSGNTIRTQAGSFELPSGTAIQFGTLSMSRKESGSTVMTSFFAQRDGFWTSQRAGVIIMCMPGGVSKFEDQGKVTSSILDGASVDPGARKIERIKIANVDALKVKYTLPAGGGSLATTSWMVFGNEATLVATLMGVTTEKFQQQFEHSTAFSKVNCSSIPGSQLDSNAPAM